MLVSSKHLTTCAIASTSLTCPKNLFPKPSPCVGRNDYYPVLLGWGQHRRRRRRGRACSPRGNGRQRQADRYGRLDGG